MKRVLGMLLIILLLAIPSLVFADKLGNFEIQDFTASVPDVSVEQLGDGRCEVTIRGLHGYGTVAGLEVKGGSGTVPVELIQNLRLLVDSDSGKVRGRAIGTFTFAEPLDVWETIHFNLPLRGQVQSGDPSAAQQLLIKVSGPITDIPGGEGIGRITMTNTTTSAYELCDPSLETEGLDAENSSATGRIRLRTQ